MPGFVIHLTAATLALSKLGDHINQNDFLFGNLAPDVWRDKRASHFRHPQRQGKRIEYPDLDLFLDKYGHLLNDSSCLGYYFHLYVDRCFFKDYFPRIVTFLDKDGKVEDELALVKYAKIAKTGAVVPVNEFLSDDYYYGDFTMSSRYLIEKYQVPFVIDTNVKNPGIEETDYSKVENLLKRLDGWLAMPQGEPDDLKVLDMDDLTAFLEKIVEEWEFPKRDNMKRVTNTILTNMCMVCDGDNILVQDKVNSSYKGVTFPGGHVEQNESLTDSIVREVLEETGLTIKNPVLCGMYDWITEEKARYLVFIYRATEFEGRLQNSREGVVRWIKKDSFLNEKLAHGMDKVFAIINSGQYTECYYDMTSKQEILK